MPPVDRYIKAATVRRQRHTMRGVVMILDYLFLGHPSEGTNEMQPPLIAVTDQVPLSICLNGGGGRAALRNQPQVHTSIEVASDIKLTIQQVLAELSPAQVNDVYWCACQQDTLHKSMTRMENVFHTNAHLLALYRANMPRIAAHFFNNVSEEEIRSFTAKAITTSIYRAIKTSPLGRHPGPRNTFPMEQEPQHIERHVGRTGQSSSRLSNAEARIGRAETAYGEESVYWPASR